MSSSVYIAGVGVISAIGNNVAGHLASFGQEKAGMGDITTLGSIHRGELPVAEVKLTNGKLAEMTGLSPDISRPTHLSLVAAKEAITDAAIPNLSKWRTGFISANTVGGMDKSEAFFVDFLAD